MKFADVRQEHAMMMALKEMNRRWQQHAVEVCGQPVHALTYQIFPIGSSGGLIEAVLGSQAAVCSASFASFCEVIEVSKMSRYAIVVERC